MTRPRENWPSSCEVCSASPSNPKSSYLNGSLDDWSIETPGSSIQKLLALARSPRATAIPSRFHSAVRQAVHARDEVVDLNGPRPTKPDRRCIRSVLCSPFWIRSAKTRIVSASDFAISVGLGRSNSTCWDGLSPRGSNARHALVPLILRVASGTSPIAPAQIPIPLAHPGAFGARRGTLADQANALLMQGPEPPRHGPSDCHGGPQRRTMHSIETRRTPQRFSKSAVPS